MNIQISGKNINTGGAFQEHAETALGQVIDKYFANAIAGHVTLEKGLEGFTVKTRVNLTRRIELEATGHDSKDAHAALDAAIAHAEKRLRRHKRRLRNHRNDITEKEHLEASLDAPMRLYQAAEQAESALADEESGDALPIIAELSYPVEQLSVDQAVMRLELSNETCLMFRNAGHLGLNMVYRRADGTLGWVDPRGVRGLAGQEAAIS